MVDRDWTRVKTNGAPINGRGRGAASRGTNQKVEAAHPDLHRGDRFGDTEGEEAVGHDKCR